jgi:hypothetical protein
MTFPRARVVVSASLFVAWLAYLAYLVAASRDTIVLSRPQFLAAEMCVLAELKDPAEEVTVLDVFWAVRPADQQLNGQKVHVANLAEAEPQGYQGPGKYILPLRRKGKEDLEVVAIPPSPGYVPAFVNVRVYDPGPDPERVARLAAEFLGVPADEAAAQLKAGRAQLFVELKRNVRRDRAVAFVNHLSEPAERGEKPDRHEPIVVLPGNDVRIYPLTPETRDELQDLIRARERAKH